MREVVAAGDPGTVPRLRRVQGTPIVAYASTRVFMKRDAWEMLPPDGILVQWIRPSGETPWAIALTRPELERVFGEVTLSESWQTARCYHFPTVPSASQAFRAVVGTRPSSGTGAPQRVDHRPSGSPAGSEARPTVLAPAEAVPVEVAAQRVLTHLRTHASLSEAEVTRIAGGARGYRRLRQHFEGPNGAITWEATPTGVVWRLAKGRS